MPVVVRTHTYGAPEFYAAMEGREAEDPQAVLLHCRAVLRGEDNAKEV